MHGMIEQNGRQLLGLGGSVRQGRANEVVAQGAKYMNEAELSLLDCFTAIVQLLLPLVTEILEWNRGRWKLLANKLACKAA